MEAGQGPNWGCSAKGQKIFKALTEKKIILCMNCTLP
jgi:hypothetical protein